MGFGENRGPGWRGKKQRKGEQYLSWSINTRHNSERPVFARSSCNSDMKIDP